MSTLDDAPQVTAVGVVIWNLDGDVWGPWVPVTGLEYGKAPLERRPRAEVSIHLPDGDLATLYYVAYPKDKS